jgi:hypothetical protein
MKGEARFTRGLSIGLTPGQGTRPLGTHDKTCKTRRIATALPPFGSRWYASSELLVTSAASIGTQAVTATSRIAVAELTGTPEADAPCFP